MCFSLKSRFELFFEMRAHPEVIKRKKAVPDAVSDVLNLWFKEEESVTSQKATFLQDFPSKRMFESVRSYAEELGALLFSNPNGGDNKKGSVLVAFEHKGNILARINELSADDYYNYDDDDDDDKSHDDAKDEFD